MAKKSDAVREMLASHPDMTAGEIAEALSRKGITISTQLVYNLRTKPGKKRRKSGAAKDLAAGIVTMNEMRGTRRAKSAPEFMAQRPPYGPGQAAAEAYAESRPESVLGTIKRVKALAADVGGLPKLRSLVEALS